MFWCGWYNIEPFSLLGSPTDNSNFAYILDNFI